MKNKNKKSINLLAVEIFLLLTATVLTTVIALNKNQSKKEDKSIETQNKKENEILDKETINNKKNKSCDKNEDEKEDENYDEENYKIETENLDKDDKKTYSKDKEKNKKKDLVVIGSFETTLETEQEKEKNRVHNIKTAAKFLDGVIINPGCTFSFHRNTWDEGKKEKYKFADTMTQNGMDKGLGGGMCQVSSTLFVAALKARMLILKRNSHSKKVRYAPLGLDASYFTGAKDLEFKNTRKTPVKIKTYYDDYKLKIEIIGEEDEKDKNYKVILHPAKKEINKKTKKMKTDVLVETKYKNETIKKTHFYSEYNID